MINYHLHKPIKLNELFNIPIDTTIWNCKYDNDKKPKLPKRKKIFHFEQLLIIKNNSYQTQLVNGHGIYILYFKSIQKVYVGISALESKKREPILTRLRKHRAKATGTNHLNGPTIDHTNHQQKGWQVVARERYLKFKNNDDLSDCYLALISIKDHEKIVEKYKGDKRYLQNFEFRLGNLSHSIHDHVFQYLGFLEIKNWHSFGRKEKGEDHEFQISTWNNIEL